MFAPRSTSLTPLEDSLRLARPNKFKLNELKNLKELRGTLNMPRVEQFLPKKEEGQPGVLNSRRNTFLESNRNSFLEQNRSALLEPKQATLNDNESPGQPPAKMVFRRQKYSKAEVRVEEI